MKKHFLLPFVLLFTVALLTYGCEKSETVSKEEKQEETNKSEVDIGNLATGGALMAEETEAGASENNKGVAHYKEGHWDVAEKHFREAIEANSNLAEAHYNLALALDKLGNHGDATSQFKTALDLAPDNPKISDSQILKDHIGS
ncbi:MAG: tetratricopeptide repeat protein [Nitrospinales bacterium]